MRLYQDYIIKCIEMMMQKIIKSLAVISVVLVARLLPFNLIIGSRMAMFSWSSIIAPVVGAQCGLMWIACFVFTKKTITLSALIASIFYRLPLFFAARAFQTRGYIVSGLIPLLCMALFIVHPVGGQAWVYSLYWLIPVALYALQDSEWTRALQAAFVSHSVGSVIWLYTGTISVDIWIALIPIVACERLLIAGGIVVCNQICHIVRDVISRMNRFIPRIFA